jgi:hypothetical protein
MDTRRLVPSTLFLSGSEIALALPLGGRFVDDFHSSENVLGFGYFNEPSTLLKAPCIYIQMSQPLTSVLQGLYILFHSFKID